MSLVMEISDAVVVLHEGSIARYTRIFSANLKQAGILTIGFKLRGHCELVHAQGCTQIIAHSRVLHQPLGHPEAGCHQYRKWDKAD